MERHSTVEAVVLENRRFGEMHKGLSLFTPDSGLVRATAFGAYSRKGSLRGITDPFVWGKFYIYRDPVKQNVKIIDVEVFDMFYGIREDVLRYYTASLWAEIILRSFGGGEASQELYGVFRECLLLVRNADEQVTRHVCTQFMLRFLQFTGAPVDPDAVSDPNMRRMVASVDSESVEESIEFAMALRDPLPDALPYLVRSVQRVLELELNTVKTAGGVLGLYS